MPSAQRLGAEFLGTFWLVFGGCGSAVLAAAFPEVGIGLLGVSLAFGLTVLTMAYAVGHISGGHFNPAVTLGLWVGGRFPAGEILPYWVVQVIGAISAAAVLYLIASGQPEFSLSTVKPAVDRSTPSTVMPLIIVVGSPPPQSRRGPGASGRSGRRAVGRLPRS